MSTKLSTFQKNKAALSGGLLPHDRQAHTDKHGLLGGKTLPVKEGHAVGGAAKRLRAQQLHAQC